MKEVGRQVLRCQTRRPVAPAQPRAAGQFPTTDACSRELSFVCFPVSDPPNPPPEPSMEARVGPGPTQKRLQIPFLQSLRRCLPGSGRSGVAASPHAPFIQPVRLIGRILSPPSPDPPLGPPLRARVASAPTQNTTKTMFQLALLLESGRGGGAERPGA